MGIQVILNELIELWPREIKLSDAKIYDGGGATIPDLITAHDLVEAIALTKGTEYEAMDWALFQALHKKARSSILRGVVLVRPDEITVALVKNNYEINLSSINESRNGNAT